MFNTILRALVKHAPLEVNKILQAMATARVKPDELTFSLLLSVEETDFNYVEEVARSMKEQGIAPGHNFFWQYIRLAVKNGEDVKAAQALAEMQQRGIKLDFHVLTLLLLLLARMISKGDLPAARAMMEKLLQAEGKEKRNAKDALNHLMKMLYYQRDYESLKLVVDLFQSKHTFVTGRAILVHMIQDWREYQNGDLYAFEIYKLLEPQVHEYSLFPVKKNSPGTLSEEGVDGGKRKEEEERDEGTRREEEKIREAVHKEKKSPQTSETTKNNKPTIPNRNFVTRIYSSMIPVLQSVPKTATEKYKLDRLGHYVHKTSPPLDEEYRERFNALVDTMHQRMKLIKEKEEGKEGEGKKKKKVYTKESREALKVDAILRKHQQAERNADEKTSKKGRIENKE